jgi:hypothetical protein
VQERRERSRKLVFFDISALVLILRYVRLREVIPNLNGAIDTASVNVDKNRGAGVGT